MLKTSDETILVDASPDLRDQLLAQRVGRIDYVFITHWHYDHFGGLADLEYYVKLARKKPIRLFLPVDAVQEYQTAYPFLKDVFEVEVWQYEKKYIFAGCSLTPLPAIHGRQTAGVLVEAERNLAYFTDTAGLPEAIAQKLTGIDYFICDATFHGDNWYPNSHMSIQQAIELGKQIEAKKTVLTHLALHYSEPITVEDLTKALSVDPDVVLAYDGLKIEL
ncbi:MAG: MBL fold metallo-hydrolase [Peptococcaceae bacterium]|nr:MBL fold metallo-hydrolase [Peptococcaceae bacterium]